MSSPRRSFRAPLVGLLVLLAAIGLAACGSSSPPSSPTPRAAADETKATGRFAAVYVSVCASAKAAEAGDEPTATRSFEDAHGGLHELAAAAETKDRGVAARLLEAKQAVESKATADDRRTLTLAVIAAIRATGGAAPSSCA